MKINFLVLLLFLGFIQQTQAQKTSEFGGFLGRSYYLGEINPKTHWGNDVGSLNYGFVYRLNLNKRYSLKASALRTKLQGNDVLTEFEFNAFRKSQFETTLTELSGQVEFNFLPYETGDSRDFFTPYLFIGLSYYFYDPSIEIDGVKSQGPEAEPGNGIAYPFGMGLKLSLGSRVHLGFEWGFRKTSNDAIDGLPNRVFEYFEFGKTYDSDWYVMSGFMLTFKLNKTGPCPVYHF